MIEFGRMYRDKITGFEGVCTGKQYISSGCDQALLTPKKGKDGKFESYWFDVQRLKPVGNEVIVLDNGRTPGAFDPAPVR